MRWDNWMSLDGLMSLNRFGSMSISVCRCWWWCLRVTKFWRLGIAFLPAMVEPIIDLPYSAIDIGLRLLTLLVPMQLSITLNPSQHCLLLLHQISTTGLQTTVTLIPHPLKYFPPSRFGLTTALTPSIILFFMLIHCIFYPRDMTSK